jgi:hypothetical protein
MILFWDPKKENYSVLILSVLVFEFFPHNPLPTFIAYVHIPLLLPNMIPSSLAATIKKLLYLNFIIINFYSVQVFKFKNGPSYISISKPVILFVKNSVTLASFAWCPASGFFAPCPDLIIISTAIVQNSG